MGYYNIAHVCGHEVSHKIAGKSVEWEKAQRAKELCTECWKAQQALNPPKPKVLLRACAEGVEVVVTNDYHYKDLLVSRGYRHTMIMSSANFAEGQHAHTLIVAPGSAGMQREIEWLANQDWITAPIKIEQGFNPLAAIAEGREDLINAKLGGAVNGKDYDKFREGSEAFSECVSEKQRAFAYVCKAKVINLAQAAAVPVADLEILHEVFPKISNERGSWWIDLSKSASPVQGLVKIIADARAKKGYQ